MQVLHVTGDNPNNVTHKEASFTYHSYHTWNLKIKTHESISSSQQFHTKMAKNRFCSSNILLKACQSSGKTKFILSREWDRESLHKRGYIHIVMTLFRHDMRF